MDELSLPARFAEGVSKYEQLCNMVPRDEDYKDIREQAERALTISHQQVRELGLISANETYHEHSSNTLRYILISAYLGDLSSKVYATIEDPDRDEKRIITLRAAIACYKEFLERCIALEFEFAPAEALDATLKMAPGDRRSREQKVAAAREMMEVEKALKDVQAVTGTPTANADLADEDNKRDIELRRIRLWVLKAADQIEAIGNELQMLEKMRTMRDVARPTEMRPDTARQRHIEHCPEDHKPVTLTKEMVQEMSLKGTSIDRCNFKLITRGYGPIGAPTMTLDQAYDMEVAMGMIPGNSTQPAQPTEAPDSDEDDEETADMKVYQARQMDEYKDSNRRGDGNRYGKG